MKIIIIKDMDEQKLNKCLVIINVNIWNLFWDRFTLDDTFDCLSKAQKWIASNILDPLFESIKLSFLFTVLWYARFKSNDFLFTFIRLFEFHQKNLCVLTVCPGISCTQARYKQLYMDKDEMRLWKVAWFPFVTTRTR